MSVTSPAPRAASEPASALDPAARAAVVLALLPPEDARAVAASLDRGVIDRIVTAYEGLGAPPRETVLAVVARFVAELESPRPAVRGGTRPAKALS